MMDTLNVIKSKDFVDRKSQPTTGHLSGIYVTEANFRTLLFKFNELVDGYNQLRIKVFDLEQALKED